MHVEIPHTFSRPEAVARVSNALEKSRAQVLEHAPDFAHEWQGEVLSFSATLQGKPISGTLLVEDKQFVLDAKLPLMWRLFEGQLEQAIKQQAAQLL